MSSPEAPAPTRPSRFGRFFWRDPNTQFLLLAAAVGVVGALGAIAFRAISIRLTQLLLDAEDIVSGAESLPPLSTVDRLSERCEHLRMKSGRSLPAHFPSILNGAEVALVTHYEAEAHVTCGCPDSFGGFRVLRGVGNDESDR